MGGCVANRGAPPAGGGIPWGDLNSVPPPACGGKGGGRFYFLLVKHFFRVQQFLPQLERTPYVLFRYLAAVGQCDSSGHGLRWSAVSLEFWLVSGVSVVISARGAPDTSLDGIS